MKEICQNEPCTGCGLCASICPQQCISFVQKELGHLYPEIDQSACINCGKCAKYCPQNKPVDFHEPISAFAAWAKDSTEYESSTSGGAASLLANQTIAKGGVVYGVTVKPQVEIEFERITNYEGIIRTKGSKYVQSNVHKQFNNIKKDVGSGKEVLFIGTPCQVAAVRKLFSYQPQNLLLVDLICHGVPSLHLLKAHISSIFNIANVSNVKFRTKMGCQLLLIDNNDTEIYSYLPWASLNVEDFYYDAFLEGYTYRNSCYQCKYACPKRCSDITIGDFWGIDSTAEKLMLPHQNGMSLIMPITEKGENAIENIKEKLNLYERPTHEAIRGNEQLRHPKKMNKRIRMFRCLSRFISPPKAFKLVKADIKIRQVKYHIIKKQK